MFELREGLADAIYKLCRPKIKPGAETSSESGSSVEQTEHPDPTQVVE